MKKIFYNLQLGNDKKQDGKVGNFDEKQLLKMPLSKAEKKKILFKRLGILGGVLVVLLIFLYIFIIGPAYTLYQDAKVLEQDARNLKSSLSAKNLTLATDSIASLQRNFVTLEKDYKRLKLLKYTPIARKYYIDGEALFKAADHGLIAGDLLFQGFKPFADVFGFQAVEGQNTEISADEKIVELVKAMPSLLPSLDAALEEFDAVEAAFQEIDPNNYPKAFRGVQVRKTIEEYKTYVTEGKKIADDIRPMLEKLPVAMGEPEPVNYLILFQNDKELRPTGGFITAYALVTLDEGRFKIIKSEDIYNIDDLVNEIEIPGPIREYLTVNYHMRDTNFSPDFKVSMQDFEAYWDKLGVAEIGGIIAVDTEFVRSFLEVLGPIELPQYGETFEASDVVFKLELYAEMILEGPYRKDFLGDLMGEMVDKVFASNSQQWKPLLDKGIEEITKKHMLFYFHDETLQNFAEEYNFAGRIQAFDGDYLHINDANLGGLKSDFWVEREVNQNIQIASDGTVTKEVAITFNNRGQHDGWFNAVTRTYTRIYVPLGSTLVSTEGGDYSEEVIRERTYDDLGKTVFMNFTRTKPLGSQTIKFTYELPFKVTGTGLFGAKSYKLLLQKQPGLGEPQPGLKRPYYTISINGEQKEAFDLLTDEEFEWEL